LERYEIRSNAEIIRKLRTIKKFENENLLDYFDRCVQLFDEYEGELNDSLKGDYIAAGSPTYLISKIMEKRISFENLRKFFIEQQRIDNVKFNSEYRSNAFQRKSKYNNTDELDRSHETKNSSERSKKFQNIKDFQKMSTIKCFNCGRFGHLKMNCTAINEANNTYPKNLQGVPVRQDEPVNERPQH